MVAATRRSIGRSVRSLGIGMAVLSVVHVPLPQADYHNIRHHDAPGEICVYHDHLLRWHPTADQDDDVSMLHWHWFVPLVAPGSQHQSAGDEQHSARPGPALHAHFGDWPAPDWHAQPSVRPDSRGRLIDQVLLGRFDASRGDLLNQPSPLDFRSRRFSPRTDNAADGLRAPRTVLFQQWNC
jgi:hypothetical protein